MGEYDIYVDLFGGSGILSHWVKHIYPSSTVIYNDFDKYEDRCKQIKETNEILTRCREVCKGLKKKQPLGEERTEEIKKLREEGHKPENQKKNNVGWFKKFTWWCAGVECDQRR